MKRYESIFNEDVNSVIDNFISMIMRKDFDKDIYTSGLEALNRKYDMINNDEWDGLRRMLISYSNNPNKRKLLSKEIIREYEFLSG